MEISLYNSLIVKLYKSKPGEKITLDDGSEITEEMLISILDEMQKGR